ncbi:MAG: acyltransferase [Patescibacteria group bacterium]|nr:acyltransferase [Patescibacteria group bacterium]
MDSGKPEIAIEHYKYLDGLRGVAALLVLSVHLPLLVDLFNGKGFGFGVYGVKLFYILSALTLFLSSSQRFASESKASLKFFLRRFFRIAPLFYAAVIVSWLYVGGVGNRLPVQGITISNIVSHFLFLFGFNKYWIDSVVGVEWSIFCEVCFYLSLPLLFRHIKNKKGAVKLAVISILIAFVFKKLISFFFPGDALMHEWSTFFILSNYFYFTFGIILFFLFKENKQYNHKALISGWCVCIFSIFLISALPAYAAALMALPLSLLVLLTRYDFPLARLLNNQATRFVGKISYSMYLTHYMVLTLLAKSIINPNLTFFNQNIGTRMAGIFGALIIVIAISAISYELIEKPGISLGKNLIKKISN